MLGRHLRSKPDIRKPSVDERVQHKQFLRCCYCSSAPSIIAVGDAVLVHNYRVLPRWVPCIVVQHKVSVAYAAKVQTSRCPAVWHRHQDQHLRSTSDAHQESHAEDSSCEYSSTQTPISPAQASSSPRTTPIPLRLAPV